MTQPNNNHSPKRRPATPSGSASLDAPDRAQRLQRLDRLEALAERMDRAFRIPFTGIRFGWDSVLGLVPGVGDTLVLAPSLYILHQARDMGAPTPVLARMAGNVGVDWLVGLVPLVGDVLDVGVKSNTRNVALLREHLNS